MPGVLEAKVTVRPKRGGTREEFVAAITLANTGDEALAVNLGPLASPSLALEIVDAQGVPARLPPPPVPGLPAARVHLAPGGQHVLEYGGFVPQWFAAGTYQVRLGYTHGPAAAAERGERPEEWTGQLYSDWFEFTISA